MTTELTDFTKQRLTRQFQAKGNSGSDLIETLQPVIVVNNLESGGFPPWTRFSVGVTCGPVAAQVPCLTFERSLVVVEETIIIDRVYVAAITSAQTVALRQSFGFIQDTVSFTPPILPHDTRLSVNQLAGTVISGGAAIAGPIVPADLHVMRLAADTTGFVDVSVIFDRKGTQPAPQLVVLGSVVNTVMAISLHGRVFPIP